jgi:hypothetical protein
MADWAKGILDFAVRTFIVVFAVYLAMNALFLSHLKRLEKDVAVLNQRAQVLDEQTRIVVSMFAPNNPQTLLYLASQDEWAGDIQSAAQKMALAVQFMEANYPAFKGKLDQLRAQTNK